MLTRPACHPNVAPGSPGHFCGHEPIELHLFHQSHSLTGSVAGKCDVKSLVCWVSYGVIPKMCQSVTQICGFLNKRNCGRLWASFWTCLFSKARR